MSYFKNLRGLVDNSLLTKPNNLLLNVNLRYAYNHPAQSPNVQNIYVLPGLTHHLSRLAKHLEAPLPAFKTDLLAEAQKVELYINQHRSKAIAYVQGSPSLTAQAIADLYTIGDMFGAQWLQTYVEPQIKDKLPHFSTQNLVAVLAHWSNPTSPVLDAVLQEFSKRDLTPHTRVSYDVHETTVYKYEEKTCCTECRSPLLHALDHKESFTKYRLRNLKWFLWSHYAKAFDPYYEEFKPLSAPQVGLAQLKENLKKLDQTNTNVIAELQRLK